MRIRKISEIVKDCCIYLKVRFRWYLSLSALPDYFLLVELNYFLRVFFLHELAINPLCFPIIVLQFKFLWFRWLLESGLQNLEFFEVSIEDTLFSRFFIGLYLGLDIYLRFFVHFLFSLQILIDAWFWAASEFPSFRNRIYWFWLRLFYFFFRCAVGRGSLFLSRLFLSRIDKRHKKMLTEVSLAFLRNYRGLSLSFRRLFAMFFAHLSKIVIISL